MERKVKEIKKKLERKEREKRRKNLIIKGLEVRERKRKEAVEGLMKDIGAEVKIEEIWRIAKDRGREREIVEIKMENEEKRRKVWEKKKRLRGGKKEFWRTRHGRRGELGGDCRR